MNENLYEIFNDVIVSDFTIKKDTDKIVIELGSNSKFGRMDLYSIFPGIILSYIGLNIDNSAEVFREQNFDTRLLEINHCAEGRYSYSIDDNKKVYFGKGDLCVGVHNLKTFSDFPLKYYRGFGILIDVDVADKYIKEYIPDFNLIKFYEELKKSSGYVMIRSNEKIDHVVGELYNVDDRIKDSYFKLKCLELLLFFSITDFGKTETLSLSEKQIKIIENVKNDLINDLESKITIDELSQKYDISKTTLKNCFKEVYGKPIFKWRKEYKLDYACRLIEKNNLSITEISKKVGYSSPSKFSQAFKDYVGCSPSEYKK